MTTKEILLGKKLFNKVNNIYDKHPEYKKFNLNTDRYQEFVNKMAEKYGTSKENIINQICCLDD